MKFTVLPFLLAMVIALAGMPLDIYEINAKSLGTERLTPWARSTPDLSARVIAWASRVREWCAELASVPLLASQTGEAALDLLVPGASQLKALRQKAAEIHGRLKDLNAKAVAAATADGTALTDDERAEVTKLKAQFDQVEALRGEAERLNEAERNFGPVKPDPDQQVAAKAGLQLVPGGSAEDKLAKSPAFFGMALHAVRKIAIHEATENDRKLVKMLAGPTGASTDIPSDGGFLIAPERSNVIVERAYDTGQIASLVTRQPIGPNANGITLPAVDETSRADGSRYGGVASSWVGQGTTVTAGKPRFRMMELKLKKLLAFVYGTDELITDATAFSSFVGRVLPLELTFRVEDSIINGDGSNKPIGVLNSGAAVSITRNTSSRVLYEDVSAMWKRMWAPLRKGAVWIIDQSVEQELEQMSMAIGTAGVLAPIYRPAGVAVGPDGTQGYSPATLYGRPILTTEYNATLGTVGDIILTNLGEYTLIDKGGVNEAVSLHVAFLTDEAVWRFTYRADGQLNWNAALTPKSGGSTVSSVVTLAT